MKSHPKKVFHDHSLEANTGDLILFQAGSLPLVTSQACFTQLQFTVFFTFLIRVFVFVYFV